jgi:hypothetical protein
LVGRLTLISVSLFASLVGLEFGYRAYLYGFDSLSPRVIDSLHPLGKSGLVQPSRYRDLGFELKPNLDAFYKKRVFRTNSRGLRDDEYRVEKLAGTFRIAAVGDSYTMGTGVAIGDAYHSLVEDRLNRSSGGGRFEVINFGVGGYQLDQYRAILH